MYFSCKRKDFLLCVLLVFAFLVFFRGDALAGFEDRRFEDVRLKLVEDIYLNFILNDECLNKIDCQKKQNFFVSPSANGIAVQLWGVKSRRAMQFVLNRCSDLFVNQPGLDFLSVDVYQITKQESMKLPFWQSVNSDVEIVFRRK